ncbi:DEAD/DEAH box helicase [Paenibacillus septentrionalis]
MMSSRTWSELGINEPLVRLLEEQQIIEPTQVQQEAIQALLAGKDIGVKSQTGSGKTLAFLLPMLQKIDISSKAIQAVVLAPTQELAMQIVRVADTYADALGVKVQQLIGGAAVKRQIEKLKLNPHLVVGTPGRMNELVKSKKLKLHAVKFLVIDEADQTFELGSPADIENLLFSINKQRQTAFFSATYPDLMERYERRWMSEPERIVISPAEKVASTIEHYYVVCDQRSKLDYTRRLLRTVDARPALLFVNDTNQISNWEAKLKFEGFKVEALYGEADKQRRASTLTAFREGKLDAILSTDVTARGIDIADLPLVIQIEPAIDADHYVHRAGRTGRMGKQGLMISIVTSKEKFIMDKFMKQLDITIEERMLFRGKLLNESQVSEATRYVPNKSGNAKRPAATTPSVSAKAVEGASMQQKAEIKGQTEQKNRVKIDKKSPKAPTKAPTKAKKKNEGKNKGAPKWLKEKRENNGQ